MRLTMTTFLTLDGVVQAPGAPDEDRTGGFEHGGWLIPYADDDLGKTMSRWLPRLTPRPPALASLSSPTSPRESLGTARSLIRPRPSSTGSSASR